LALTDYKGMGEYIIKCAVAKHLDGSDGFL
jgi:hypothetical protein